MRKLVEYESSEAATLEQPSERHIELLKQSVEPHKGSVPIVTLLMRKHFSAIDKTSQISYYHFLKNYPIEFTTAAASASPSQIKRMRQVVMSNFLKFSRSSHDCKDENIVKVQHEYDLITNEEITDEDLSLELMEDLGTIKIVRFLANSIVQCNLQIIK